MAYWIFVLKSEEGLTMTHSELKEKALKNKIFYNGIFPALFFE